MSDIFNIIKKALRSNSFYIPSSKTVVNGCSLNVKQFNSLLELKTNTEFGFEQYIKYSILSDNIIAENLDSTANILKTDKPFILTQIKMVQDNEFLGLSLQDYVQGLKEKTENLPIHSYSSEVKIGDLAINFKSIAFEKSKTITKEFFESLNGDFTNTSDIVTLELFKHLNSITYGDKTLDSFDVKTLKEIIDSLPATTIETFNDIFKRINDDTRTINTFNIKEQNFVFNPTLEFMLL